MPCQISLPSVQRVAPLGEKPQNQPLSKLNTGALCNAAGNELNTRLTYRVSRYSARPRACCICLHRLTQACSAYSLTSLSCPSIPRQTRFSPTVAVQQIFQHSIYGTSLSRHPCISPSPSHEMITTHVNKA